MGCDRRCSAEKTTLEDGGYGNLCEGDILRGLQRGRHFARVTTRATFCEDANATFDFFTTGRHFTIQHRPGGARPDAQPLHVAHADLTDKKCRALLLPSLFDISLMSACTQRLTHM